MTINKFQGKTENEAVEKAKKEMGNDVVIMNVRVVKPKGIFAAFKKSTYEVTAALEEKEQYTNPIAALKTPMKMHDNINMAADENIVIPVPEKKSSVIRTSESIQDNTNELEERLVNLQNLIEKKLPSEKNGEEKKENAEEIKSSAPEMSEEFKFLKMIYGILLENEVNEKYVNEILEDIEKVARKGSSVDILLSNIYQKMILKFGTPKTIELSETSPKVVFFIGPTGVGKTTTIAKIASKYKVEQGKKIAFLTADTYRIAAAEQLRTYANILDTPLTIIYSPEEMNAAIDRVKDYDLVLVDTAGFSHKNNAQRMDTRNLIESLDVKYQKEVFLVLSATTKYKDLLDIADIYHEIADYKLIFTKLDETTSYGNLLNLKLYSGADISYVTNGQNVPDDIEVFNTQGIVKQLLGGK